MTWCSFLLHDHIGQPSVVQVVLSVVLFVIAGLDKAEKLDETHYCLSLGFAVEVLV